EPPQPFGVTVAEAPKSVPVIPAATPRSDAPKVEFPTPAQVAPAAPAPTPAPEPVTPLPAVTRVESAPVVAEPEVREEPVVVDSVAVETQRGDTVTRKQVSADGKRIEEVPVEGAAPRTTATRTPAPRPATTSASTTTRRSGPQFIVQVGAFSVEANAKALQERLTSIGQRAYIDKTSLWRVRIGPYSTRDQAVTTRSALEAKGLSAIIVTE
ncbi:MAG TPA: SPOR domain-containing protein, partial [Thermoanaerobaculia bacterium]